MLRNLLELQVQEELDEAELILFLERAEEPFPAGDLGPDHYLSLHHHLFQDVYGWAGQIRTIRIGKGQNWFCFPEYIQVSLAKAFAEYGDPDEVAALPVQMFVQRTAHLLAEINAVHPFREGNGRTQLAFLNLLAANAGYTIDHAHLEPERVLAAMIDSFDGDERALSALLAEALMH